MHEIWIRTSNLNSELFEGSCFERVFVRVDDIGPRTTLFSDIHRDGLRSLKCRCVNCVRGVLAFASLLMEKE